MEIYRSDEEQVEALKRWWDQNGRMVLTGIAIALLAVFGWRAWQDYRSTRAEAASVQYQQLLAMAESNPAAALEQGRRILGEYPSTTYADFASLTMAAIAVQQGDTEAAAAHLRAVMNEADRNEIKLLARLRLSKVLLDQGKADEALALVQGQQEAGSFRAAFAELTGDILLAKGERSKARAAYTDALANYDLPAKQRLVQVKLDDLADVKEGAE